MGPDLGPGLRDCRMGLRELAVGLLAGQNLPLAVADGNAPMTFAGRVTRRN
ncbi:hypothetical protein [Halorussus pelagicus]|uniref:hypothetical protein n=1 Tax=Halorussus pelagicus TaxID=2505977 RepID=UPI00140D7992|nr:hypothetical protein [Halorussus pelagicus]